MMATLEMMVRILMVLKTAYFVDCISSTSTSHNIEITFEHMLSIWLSTNAKLSFGLFG